MWLFFFRREFHVQELGKEEWPTTNGTLSATAEISRNWLVFIVKGGGLEIMRNTVFSLRRCSCRIKKWIFLLIKLLECRGRFERLAALRKLLFVATLFILINWNIPTN
ncbi:hypothetical protein CDAR_437981 [Caerostris darwini]|uniref:Uncharacterized protein n=1 Tax=Caerostris darwini TaxID=1538125 RepID=A0AAV4TTB0_9ARAC|nr:hypothetical protein CDAR_437981 [Caerostris darwini]